MTYISQPRDRVVGRAGALDRSRPARFVSYRTLGLVVAILDYGLIVLASIAAGVIYHAFMFDSVGDIGAFAAIGTNAALLFVLLTKSRGFYRTPALISDTKQIRGTVSSWILVLLAVTALLFLLKIGVSFSRGATIGFGFLGLGLLLGSRAITATKLSRALASGTLPGRPAVVIGDREELADCAAVHLFEKYGAREVGRFELSPASGDDLALAGRDLPVVDAAIEAARANQAEKVLLALRWTDTRRRDLVCERLRVLPLQVFLLPDRFAGAILSQPTREMGTQIAIELQRAPLSRLELAAKRSLDVAFAGVTLLLLLPLLAVVSLAIKLDSRGPVIFRQHRKGFNGREFAIYKFRTMTVLEDGGAIRQARRGDERVTSLGRLLRATSIDELPQLVNVLRGEMSVVGPRPHALAHDDEYARLIANYAFRHHVKPGITGWAQVKGLRGETAEPELMKRRVDLDLWYTNNWSIALDLWIIFRTCVVIARGRNAY